MAVLLSPVGGVAAQFFDNNGKPLSGGKLFTYAAGSTTPAATFTSSLGITAHTNPIVLDAAGRVPGGEIWLTDGIIYKFVLQTSTNVLIATYDNIVGINSNFVNFTVQQEIQTATAGQTVFNLNTMQYQPGTNSLSVFVDGVNQYGPGAQFAYVETDATTVTFVSGLHVGASVKFTTAAQTTGNATDASVVAFTGFKNQIGTVQNLADDDGSDWIGFEPAGAGAVARSVQDKLRETVSAKDFGAVGDGVTDDTAAINNAITFAIANNKVVIFDFDATIRVPTDAPTLQDAFNHATTSSQQINIIILVESSYVLTSGLLIQNADYSNFTIKGQDASYIINAGFTGDILRFDNCRAPIIDIKINASGATGVIRGFVYANTSSGVILPNAGVSNVTAATPGGSTGNGLFLENCSTVNASNSVFTGCNLRNVHITTASRCELSGADLSGGAGDWNVFVSRASSCVLDGANVSGNTVGGGVAALRSRVSMVPFSTSDLNCSGNATINLSATDSAIIFAGLRSGRKVNFSNAGTIGVQAQGSCTIDAEGADISNAGTFGILANNASTVNAKNATITGCNQAVLSTNSSRVELESANCSGSITQGIEARRNGSIGGTLCNARMGGSDAATDVVITAGGLINFNSGIGGVSTTVNTLTGAGIIFR